MNMAQDTELVCVSPSGALEVWRFMTVTVECGIERCGWNAEYGDEVIVRYPSGSDLGDGLCRTLMQFGLIDCGPEENGRIVLGPL